MEVTMTSPPDTPAASGQKVRTSLSHPLRIDVLQPHWSSGLIGMTICPGKKGESVFGAAWDRDLVTDLGEISAWGADCVVTLMEDFEFSMLGIPDFSAVMAAQPFDWLHLEIRDADVPDRRFETAWPAAREAVLAVLERGGKVLVHCRGGLGRTGLVVARLLVEQGMAAEEAIRLTREARHGAIETRAQERHVLAIAPLSGSTYESDDGSVPEAVLDQLRKAVPQDQLSNVSSSLVPEASPPKESKGD
jgi:hypothetical protein